MANKPKPKTEEGEDAPLRRPGRLDRPKQKPSNRMLKPNGRTGAYETK